jgi:hypothetical protein
MTDDRTLLEMAAKAAGICLHKNVKHSYGNWGCDTTCLDCGKDTYGPGWHPLTDDGDALRLAVKLELAIDCSIPGRVQCAGPCGIGLEEYHARNCSDPYAATRRAIVRAAASIGSSDTTPSSGGA